MTQKLTRRDFVKAAGGCAALSSVSILSTLLNLRLTNSVVAATGDTSGYKAMVCLFLFGGNDSHQMLVPREDQEYTDYASIRSNLAIDKDTLLPIADSTNRKFGIYPGMPEVKSLYDRGKLAFVANIGSLIRPTSRQDYQNKVSLPVGLFSHSDLIQHWQTSIPQSRAQLTGWAGRMADILTDSSNSNSTISMNIALNSLNILQTGQTVQPYIIQTNGATTLAGYGAGNTLDRILTRTTDGLLNQTYSNLLEQTHATARRDSIDAAVNFNSATQSVQLNTQFPATSLGSQLQMVAKTIGARQSLGHSRQVFFVSRGGFDNHDGLLQAQAASLPEISQALSAFYAAMEELGVQDNVVAFTKSDFGRTLSSNGNGSDHAWAGNHIVLGGSVKGGEIYGNYPTSLALGNPIDVGRGRIIPDTSVDEYAAELAMWFGISNGSELEAVLPNIRNFYAAGGSARPIGFMA